MNSDDRKLVNDYFEDRDTSTLHLAENALDQVDTDSSIKDIIYSILTLSNRYFTQDEDGREQCYPGAYRSSGDIWRLVKYIKSDVTIFQVMHELHSLVEDDELYCAFCEDILKRVFSSDDDGVYHRLEYDEYELYFDDWKEI